MKVSVTYLAKLANFTLSEEQTKIMEESIPSVLGYMEDIKNLDVGTVFQTNAVIEEKNIFREDVVEPSLSQEEALSNAKKTYHGFFVVPSIFDEAE